jgi:hypothetical protein
VKIFEKENVFDMKNAVYTVTSLSGDSTYNTFFVRKLKEDKGFSKAFLLYHYANFLCRMQPSISLQGIEVLKNELLADQDKNKQLLSFGLGALERIKDTYDREKAIYNGLQNSGKEAQKRYARKVKGEMSEVENVITHAKAAIEEVKKSTE